MFNDAGGFDDEIEKLDPYFGKTKDDADFWHDQPTPDKSQE